MSKSNRRNQRQAGPAATSTSSRRTSSGEDGTYASGIFASNVNVGSQALKSLFDRRPKFTKPASFLGSAGTRDPAQYDMHLHSQLILKDVVLFPDMLDQLVGAVNSKLYPPTGGTMKLPRVPDSHVLDPALVRKQLKEDKSGFIISHESDLQKSYPSLQKLSSLVASTLFAGLDQWSDIFEFNNNPTSMTPCALADGYLSFDKAAMANAGLSRDLDRIFSLSSRWAWRTSCSGSSRV